MRLSLRRASRWLAPPILGAVLGAGAGCGWLLEKPSSSRGSRPPATQRSLFTYPWVWTDENGESVKLERWRGESLVVTLAFTSCRETCPRTIHQLRNLDARFRREGRAARFVVVSLDPVNDTPERLREFRTTERLPDSWQLPVGTAPATRQLSQILDVHVVELDSHIMHDGSIVEFDARGYPARSFTGWNLDRETPLAGPRER